MKIERKEFENIRIEIYIIFQVTGILQCILPLKYLCDYNEYSCIMCEMRHAIDYVLQLDFRNAYKSNPLIFLIIAIGILMIIDTSFIVFKRIRNWCN